MPPKSRLEAVGQGFQRRDLIRGFGEQLAQALPVERVARGGEILAEIGLAGDVVGVIFDGQFDPGEDVSTVSYALSPASINQLLKSGGSQAVEPCEQ
jgi:hypothetical protein